MPIVLPRPVQTLAAQSGQAWPQSPNPYPGADPGPGGMGSTNGFYTWAQSFFPPQPQYGPGINATGGVGSNPYGPPSPQAGYQGMGTAPQPQAQPAFGTAGQNIWQAQNAALSSQYGVYGAQQNALGAQRAVFNSQRQGLSANMATLAARGSALGAEAGLRRSTAAYVTEQQRARDQRLAETQQLQSAQNNVGDQTAVGLEDLRRASRDRALSSNLGVIAPAQVTVPLGQEGARTPVGTEVASETQATRVGRRNVQQDALSTLAVEQARLDNARAEGTVSDAQARVQQAQLDADRQNLSTQAAQINAGEAGLGTQQAQINAGEAGLNVHAAEQPPAAGMVYDETSGTFVSPAQAAVNQANSNRVVWDPVNGRYVERAGTELSPSSNGLYQTRGGIIVNQQTGIPTDSRTGNQFVNGAWTDPQSGNTYDPATGQWVDPASGNRYHVVNHQTGAGFWVNPQGMYMSSDGIWRDPVSGQAVYGVTGQQYSTRRSSGGGYAAIP